MSFCFGGGSRGCIGTAFSMYEMMVLATVLSHFQLRLLIGVLLPVRRGIDVPSSSGVQMVITESIKGSG